MIRVIKWGIKEGRGIRSIHESYRERMEETSNSYSIGGRRTEGSGWKVSRRVEHRLVKFRRAIHSSFSARVFPPRGALKFQNVATGRARMPTTFAASVCAAYAVPFVPTRIQKSIYIYDVSGLDDTATGYAGLEASRGWQEQNGGGVEKKEERKERNGKEKSRSFVQSFFIPWPTFWTNTFRVYKLMERSRGRRRKDEDDEKEDEEEGFHDGEIPFGIFLISNLFKFPTTVTREGIKVKRNKSFRKNSRYRWYPEGEGGKEEGRGRET